MANVLITGTSSGIGLVTTLELARAGHRVFATMRNVARGTELREIAAREGFPLEILQLNVDSDESVTSCFAAITEPLDVLINNAGVECHGSIEELPMDAFVATMDTNYLGAVRCIKAVLPRMRQARRGCIINISSVAGHIAASPLGPYAASKFALECISEVLAGEVNRSIYVLRSSNQAFRIRRWRMPLRTERNRFILKSPASRVCSKPRLRTPLVPRPPLP